MLVHIVPYCCSRSQPSWRRQLEARSSGHERPTARSIRARARCSSAASSRSRTRASVSRLVSPLVNDRFASVTLLSSGRTIRSRQAASDSRAWSKRAVASRSSSATCCDRFAWGRIGAAPAQHGKHAGDDDDRRERHHRGPWPGPCGGNECRRLRARHVEGEAHLARTRRPLVGLFREAPLDDARERRRRPRRQGRGRIAENRGGKVGIGLPLERRTARRHFVKPRRAPTRRFSRRRHAPAALRAPCTPGCPRCGPRRQPSSCGWPRPASAAAMRCRSRAPSAARPP